MNNVPFSKISDHTRVGKELIAPWNTIPNLELTSWLNDRLPECLWVALLVTALPRERYLDIFKQILDNVHRFCQQKKSYNILSDHSAIAALSQEDFLLLFGGALAEPDIKNALSPLLIFDSLPDKQLWETLLIKPTVEEALAALPNAILECADHSAFKTIDIRYIKVGFAVTQGRIHLDEKHFEVAELITHYGNNPTQEVALLINTFENVLRALNSSTSTLWPENFWQECFKKSPCFQELNEFNLDSEFDYEDAKKQWAELYCEILDCFDFTISTTEVDAKHEGIFGLVLYAMTLVQSMIPPHSMLPSGRILLRTLSEVAITFAFLIKKDDLELWKKHRNYGAGKAKLSFLKSTESQSTHSPKYLDSNLLYKLANEDRWQEFNNMNLGHWCQSDVRKMADEAGVKNLYDDYYDWPSSYVHCSWGAVRDSVFDICQNPLHKFHLIPRFPRKMEEVFPDALKIMNFILELLAKVYPDFNGKFAIKETACE